MENEWWEAQSKQMQQYADRGNSHAYFKAAKQIFGPKQSKSIPQRFRTKEGSLTQTASEALDTPSRTLF
jgi:hypothetical protein